MQLNFAVSPKVYAPASGNFLDVVLKPFQREHSVGFGSSWQRNASTDRHKSEPMLCTDLVLPISAIPAAVSRFF